MQTTIKEQLQNTYPPILSLENIRVILRISKRKAAWVIDFLATEGYKVQNKSLLHTRLLLQYYNQ